MSFSWWYHCGAPFSNLLMMASTVFHDASNVLEILLYPSPEGMPKLAVRSLMKTLLHRLIYFTVTIQTETWPHINRRYYMHTFPSDLKKNSIILQINRTMPVFKVYPIFSHYTRLYISARRPLITYHNSWHEETKYEYCTWAERHILITTLPEVFYSFYTDIFFLHQQ